MDLYLWVVNSVLLQKLHFIESIFDESDFLHGEELVDSTGSHLGITKSRSTYTVQLHDRKVKIKLKKGQLDFEANPPLEEKSSKGELVLAGIHLRKYLTEEEEKEKVKTKTQRARRISSTPLSSLLEDVPHQQLLLFVQSYAKKDKHFSARLQANFISKYGKDRDKYADLLATIVKPKSEKSPKLPQKDLQTAISILDNYRNQGDDLYSLGKYKELSQILLASLKKIAYIENTYGISNNKVESLRVHKIDVLRRTTKKDIAPELSEELLSEIVDIASLSYYQTNDLTASLYEIIYSDILTNEEQVVTLLEALKSKYDRQDKFRKPDVLCAALLLASRFESTLKSAYETWETTDIVPAINKLLAMEFFTAVDQCLQLLEGQEDLQKEISLLKAERYYNSKQEAKSLHHYMIWMSYKPKVFELVKRVQRLDLELLFDHSKEIASAVDHYPVANQLYIYDGLGLSNLLTAALAEAQDMSLMQQYDRELVEDDPEFIVEFYDQWITTYLSEHFGTKPIVVVENHLRHLADIGMKTYATSIKKKLKEEFQSRKSVKEHI